MLSFPVFSPAVERGGIVTKSQPLKELPGFRKVQKTGVIYVMGAAVERGFHYGHPDWTNLGQGAPETGALPGSPARLEEVPVAPETLEYAPVGGYKPLRQAVADLYNARYRVGMKSKYTYENVAIAPGGRASLTRVAAVLGNVNLGHFLPDYTAYEELLDIFRAFVAIPILIPASEGFMANAKEIRNEIVGKGLGALLLSNPCNPTGQMIREGALGEWVSAAREFECALILDEFYSHYLYGEARVQQPTLSAAAYIENVNRDPLILLDGLTKNWRYPGLRIAWTLGPKSVIEKVISAGSFLDGGACHAVQKRVVPLLDRSIADGEAAAIQKHFSQKRNLMIQSIRDMGFVLPRDPEGTFYCFASLENLPTSLQDGMDFFKKALEKNVITVPGVFFDVNPGHRRNNKASRLRHFVRLSFGPSMDSIQLGLKRLAELIEEEK